MIKSQLTLKQLEAFVFVADFGTFRKAATALGTTQPNISVRIAALEETLGTILMHRDAGTIRLTEKGIELLAASRSVLRAAETVLKVAERTEMIQERLRLGVTELVASTWLHDFLRALKQAYPAVRVELTVNLSQELLQDLDAYQLDLAILNDVPASVPSEKITLGDYRYGWIATPDMVQELGARPKPLAMFTYPVMTHGRKTKASHALAEFAKREKLPTTQIVHSSSLTACLHMALDGMGIALLPQQLYKDRLASGELSEVDIGWLPDPLAFFAIYDKERAPIFVRDGAEIAARIAARTK